MEWLRTLFFIDGNLLGIEWNLWKVIGMLGNGIFFSRFLVQWYASERRGQVVVPVAFWWLSLAGSSLLLAYALFYRQDSVFILAYAFTWIPYIRNLVIHHRQIASDTSCSQCSTPLRLKTPFCPFCGQPIHGRVPVDSKEKSSQK